MKRILSIFLVCGMLCTLFYGIERAEAYTDTVSGSCGESLYWKLNTETGTLTISGTGKMTDYAFWEAPWMEYADSVRALELQEGMTSIGSYAFCLLEQVAGTLILPESLQAIECYAFQGCYGFTGDLRIPDNVERIESNAFDGCEGLNGTLTLGKKLACIKECAFYGCAGLSGNLVLPDSLHYIGESAFAGCGFTGTVSVGVGLVSEEDTGYAVTGKTFEGCTGIKGFSVAAGNPNLCAADGILYTKDKSTLLCCPAGKSGALSIEKTVKSIAANAFLSCRLLTGTLSLPETLTEIGENAFRNCRGFSGELTIPDGVRRIGDCAFLNCSGFSDRIVLGSAVEQIGAKAFIGCSGAKQIYFKGNAPEIDTGYKTASFSEDVCLYFTKDATYWNDSEWCGYQTAIWNPAEDNDPSGGDDSQDDDPQEEAKYRHYIRLEDATGTELLTYTEQTVDGEGLATDRLYRVTEDFMVETLTAGEALPQSIRQYFPGNTHYTVAAEGHKNLSGTFTDADITTTIVLTRRECRTETEYQWEQDGKTGEWFCTARYSCIYEGCTETVTQTETATVENGGIRTEVTADCTHDGARIAEAVFRNTLFTMQKKTIETVKALGHRWAQNADGSDFYTLDREATETQEGQMSVHCTVCDAIRAETVTVIPKITVIPTLTSISLDRTEPVTLLADTENAEILHAAAYSEKGVVLTASVSWTIVPAGQGVTMDAGGRITVSPDAKAGSYTITAAPVDGKTKGNALHTVLKVQRIEITWPTIAEKTGYYGESLDEILTLSGGTVQVGNTTLDGTFRLVNGSEYPDAGACSYQLQCTYSFSGEAYTVFSEQYTDAVVLPKEVTVSAGTFSVSKVYDGTLKAGTATGALALSGILSKDINAVGVEYRSIGAYSASDAGEGYSVSVSGLALKGNERGNYVLKQDSVTVPACIEKAQPLLRDLSYTIEDTVYHGQTQEISVQGKNGYGTLTVFYNGSSQPPKNAGTYTVTISVAESRNYNAAEFSIGSYTIAPQEISVAAAVIQEKVCNGQTDDARVKVTFSGLADGETLTAGLDYTVSGQYASANAGDAVAVTITIALLDTAISRNYRLAFSTFQTTGKIALQSGGLVISAADTVYNGRVYAKSNIEVLEMTEGLGNPVYSYYETSEDAENQQNALSGTPKNAGTYWIRADVKANGNIAAASAIDCFDILPVTLTADNFAEYFEYDLSSVPYNVSTQPVSVTLKSAYSAKGTTTIRYNQQTERPKNAGTYLVTVSISGGTNFRAAENILLGEYQILPQTVSIVWNAETLYYYDRNPKTVTAVAANVLEGDTVNITVSGGKNTAVGTYTAQAVATDNANYQLSTENSSFSYEIRYAVSAVNVLSPETCSATLDNPNLTIRFSGTVRNELCYTLNTEQRTLTKEQIQSETALTVTVNGVSYVLDYSAVWLESEDDGDEEEYECEGLRRVEISEGRHTLYLDGREAGTYIFARYGDGWTIYDEAEKQYLSVDKTEKAFRYSTEPFSWNLEEGFCTETESDAITPFAARLGTVRWYLTQGENGLTVGGLPVKAELYEQGKGEHVWAYRSVNGQEHEVYCTVCGAIRSREAHQCNAETGLCVCGYENAETNKIRVTLRKAQSEDIRYWRITYYEIAVEGVEVSRVEYSTDGGKTWEEGTAFALLEEAEAVQVRVTDYAGIYYVTEVPVSR